jgi:hypothetical protein
MRVLHLAESFLLLSETFIYDSVTKLEWPTTSRRVNKWGGVDLSGNNYTTKGRYYYILSFT